jgi:hypothetical protein
MSASKAPPAAAEPEAATPPDAPDVPVEQPTGSDLVVRDGTNEHEVITVIDRHDEALIVEELQRRVLKVMLYKFSQGGSEITDLSYLGVNEAVRVMNDSRKWQITIDRGSLVVESVNEDLGAGPEPCWQATVYAINEATGYGQFGTYTQPKRMKLKDQRAIKRAKDRGDHVDEDGRIADKFSRQKAVNKAQRNALRIHIPEQVRQTLIAQYQGNPDAVRVIQAGAGAAQLAELPPPLTDERAEAQKKQAREVYDELREINTLAVLPAAFHAYMARAEHSHDRLEEFIAYLLDKVEQEKAKEGSA